MSSRRSTKLHGIWDVEYDDEEDCPEQSDTNDQVIEIEDFLDAQNPDGKYFVPLDTHLGEIPPRHRNAFPCQTNDDER